MRHRFAIVAPRRQSAETASRRARRVAGGAGLAAAVAVAAALLFLMIVARPLLTGRPWRDDLPAGPAAVTRFTVDAPFARQGVAVSDERLYAVSDHGIQALDRGTGRVVAEIDDPVRFRHLNSCVVRRNLICAHSNFPLVPMQSSVETFDAATLRPIASHRLAESDGSLTWLVPWADGWLACLANYDGHGGAPARDHRATRIVRLSAQLTPLRRYRLPDAVLERMAPHSASGGAIGPDGFLYVTGHDRPEAYVLAMPRRGDVLRLVATIGLPTGGQAIAFDPVLPRLLWSVDRRGARIVASELPVLNALGARAMPAS